MDGAHGDPKLHLGNNIFLSHSGAEKGFIRFLNEALTIKGYDAFFDERSLEKGVQINMEDILAKLKDARLAVILLSNAFLTRTPHPMSELSAAVTNDIQMLPIFYDFSVDEFKVKCRNHEWLPTWRTWVEEGKISEDDIRKWEDALKVVSSTNGLEFCKEATNDLELRDKIVAKVCHIVKCDFPWTRPAGAQGMDRLCRVVSEKFLESSHGVGNGSFSERTVVGGMYGISGIGKSTLCRALCGFFFREFDGRVCYIELGDCSKEAIQKRLKMVLVWLSGASPREWDDSSDEQLWNVFKTYNKRRRDQSRPVFLAIDNVCIGESMDEAENYLSCGPFPPGSKIFLTSQKADVLEDLLSLGHIKASTHSWVYSFPRLEFAEAKQIFLHKALPVEHMTTLSDQQNDVVNECVSMCTFNKHQSDYFPLMLIALASYLRHPSCYDPLQWKGKLEKLQRDGMFASTSPHMERLESIFGKAFNSLTEEQQNMFVDLALYVPGTKTEEINFWLESAYPCQNVDDTLLRLAALFLVEATDGWSWSVNRKSLSYKVHDLLRDFVKKKVREKEGLKSCTRIFKEHDTVVMPLRGPWLRQGLIERVGFLRCNFNKGSTLDLSGIREIEVLHLVHNKGLECVRLSGTACSSLQSVIIESSTPIKVFIVTPPPKPQREAFYMSLENFVIGASSCLQSFGLTCSNVRAIKLDSLQKIVGPFRNLKRLQLSNLPNLRAIVEFQTCSELMRIKISSSTGMYWELYCGSLHIYADIVANP